MVNIQVYQTIRTEKSSKIRCENKLKITISDDSSQGQEYFLENYLAELFLIGFSLSISLALDAIFFLRSPPVSVKLVT